MIYRHAFQVSAPLARVAEFHSRADSLTAITPPPVTVRLEHAPPVLAEGDEISFTMWIGPFPIRWLARIGDVSPNGFTDTQLGDRPFAVWVHRHTFTALDEQVTGVEDEVTLKLSAHPFWGLVGLGMRLSLPILFAYRAWKTRKILQ